MVESSRHSRHFINCNHTSILFWFIIVYFLLVCSFGEVALTQNMCPCFVFSLLRLTLILTVCGFGSCFRMRADNIVSDFFSPHHLTISLFFIVTKEAIKERIRNCLISHLLTKNPNRHMHKIFYFCTSASFGFCH